MQEGNTSITASGDLYPAKPLESLCCKSHRETSAGLAYQLQKHYMENESFCSLQVVKKTFRKKHRRSLWQRRFLEVHPKCAFLRIFIVGSSFPTLIYHQLLLLFLQQKALEAQGSRLLDKAVDLWLINSSLRLFGPVPTCPLQMLATSVHAMSASPSELLLWLPVRRQVNTKPSQFAKRCEIGNVGGDLKTLPLNP